MPIARTVTESACSHYSRKDLQRLFEIQPRSAQMLMGAMPVVAVGNAYLIEKEALLKLLQQLNEAEDPTRAFASLRSTAVKPLRRKLRALSLRDVAADLDLLPQNLILNRGEMTVHFETVDQLAEVMVYLAALLQQRLDEFAARYEPAQTATDEDLRDKQHVRLDAEYVQRWSAGSDSPIV